MTQELPETPLTGTQRYLAKIAGQDVELPPKPLTMDQMYLAKIAENGGGGTVQDVQVNGTSVLSGGIANVSVPTVVQSTGTSTTDVMSQNAVTALVGNVETLLTTLISGGGAQ